MNTNFLSEFAVQENKLATLLADHNLVHRFDATNYPITITISPDVSMDGQESMLEMAEDGISSADAKLSFIFPVGDIEVRTFGRLYISDSLMTKVKGLCSKMHSIWLQAFFAAGQTDGKDGTAGTIFDGFYDAE